MNISNYELAVLIGELTGSKTTSMSYGAALAVFRDDSKPCTVDDVAELLRGAMQHPSRRKSKKACRVSTVTMYCNIRKVL